MGVAVLNRNVVLDGRQFGTIPIDSSQRAVEGITAFEKAFSAVVSPEDADWIPVFDPEDGKWNVDTIGCYGCAVNYKNRRYFVQPGQAHTNGLGVGRLLKRIETLAEIRDNAESFAAHVAVGVSRFDFFEYLGKRKINMDVILSKKAWPIIMFLKEHDQPSPSGAVHDFHFASFRRIQTPEGLKYGLLDKPGYGNPEVSSNGQALFSKIAKEKEGTWRFGGFFAAYQHS
ncbi:MAG: hypothetical protein AAF569_07260 [Pseudomonadota bacterium]